MHGKQKYCPLDTSSFGPVHRGTGASDVAVQVVASALAWANRRPRSSEGPGLQQRRIRSTVGLHCHMVEWTLHMSIDLVRPSDATSARALLCEWTRCLPCPAHALPQLARAKGGFSVKIFPCVVCCLLLCRTGGSVVVDQGCRQSRSGSPRSTCGLAERVWLILYLSAYQCLC